MGQAQEDGFNIWRMAGSIILIALTSAFYFGFVITLFAGFTADIQRDALRRELGASSPGTLERLVLQAYHEAVALEEQARLRTSIRELDARALQDTRNGLIMQKDAVLAWWEAFDGYSRLAATVTKHRASFDGDFTAVFSDVMNSAYQLVSDQKSVVTMDGAPTPQNRANSSAIAGNAGNPFAAGASDAGGSGGAGDGAGVSGVESAGSTDQSGGDVAPPDFLVDEITTDTTRQAEAAEVMASLHVLLDKPKFTKDASPALVEQVNLQVDAIRAAMIRYDEKNARAQVEWANIHSENRHAALLRKSLENELEETQAQFIHQGDDLRLEMQSLVALFQHPVGRILSYLIQLPTIMLTLLVTVAAGGLGAVVAFTRQNFGRPVAPYPAGLGAGQGDGINDANTRNPDALNANTGRTDVQRQGWTHLGERVLPAARLFVMTGEGIAAAMAIFLCAEAGMLMVSQGGPDGTGQIDISPFLVTFMAFVSGFMAEDAFARIQFAGKKIFRMPGDEGDHDPKKPDAPTP
ncbi:MAG: hypothetical protein VX620_07915 [Pseudomonadota bacterium]|nr:hypothetical protein [Pseudomonadota bacterium]